MKKRFKMVRKSGNVYILRWDVEGSIFGPVWQVVAGFVADDRTLKSCKEIVDKFNECEEHSKLRNK